MRKAVCFLLTMLFASATFAACPKGTRYDCYTDYRTDKQVCGCKYY